jgi:uncharacterized membrane protein YhaH (DUF805 family)
MDFVTSIKTCLAEKYAEFNGRASRPEFWWFMLFCFVVNMLAGMIFRGWISTLISLALLVPSLAVGARRLHDIGKSGWFQLLGIIPVIGWAILIYWTVQPGHAGANQYGDAPTDTPPPPPEMAAGPQ